MPIKTVSATTLKHWLDKAEALLVDVREPAEYRAESIVGSTLVPLATVSKSLLPECTGKKLVIHCRKGGRGSTACETLLAEDPTLDIYNLEGGIDAWKLAGFAVQSSGSSFLPLDRQVQLTVGVVVLTASILGYFLSPYFFVISGFCGAGLTVAGLTGFCGLARVIAKMPWNQGGGTSCCAATHS